MTNGNPATEKSGGTKNTAHGMLAGEEREGQDADTRRVERLNAAYERDRTALAKTDPAFARGTFRDVGHAEGSDETDGNALRKILSMEKNNFIVDLEKEKDTEKKE